LMTRQKTSKYLTYAACETGLVTAEGSAEWADLPEGFKLSEMSQEGTVATKDAATVTLLDILDHYVQQINIEAGKAISQGYRHPTLGIIEKYYRGTIEVIGRWCHYYPTGRRIEPGSTGTPPAGA